MAHDDGTALFEISDVLRGRPAVGLSGQSSERSGHVKESDDEWISVRRGDQRGVSHVRMGWVLASHCHLHPTQVLSRTRRSLFDGPIASLLARLLEVVPAAKDLRLRELLIAGAPNETRDASDLVVWIDVIVLQQSQ